MTNYSAELSRVENLIKQNFYTSAVLKSFQVLELGFKDLYKSLELFLESNGKNKDWEQLHIDFKKGRSESFNFPRAGFGSMLLFARHTKFWNHIREMCDSNLRFVRMVNWEHIRIIRNNVTHQGGDISRTDALEILFWSKIFLYESGLIKGKKNPIPEVLDTDCSSCNHTISLGWNYCPHCGTNTKTKCPSCNRAVNNNNKVCPHCDYTIIKMIEITEVRLQYKSYAEAIWADWIVTPLEKEWLKQKRLQLGLNLDEAEEIEKSVIPSNYFVFSEIIEATQVDGKIDKYEREFLHKKAQQLNIPPEIATNLINATSSLKQQKTAVRRLIAMF